MRFQMPFGFILPLIATLLIYLTVSCEQRQQSTAPRPVPEVATVKVEHQRIVLTTELPGRTSAYRIAEIRPQVSGLIEKRKYKEGSFVKAGQVLYRIDSEQYQAVLDSAKANHTAAQKASDRARAALEASTADVSRLKVVLELARSNLKRYEESYEEKIVSAIQLDQAVAEVKVAESSLRAAEANVKSNRGAIAAAEAAIKQADAAIRTARINLEYCRITAPISGRIGKSNVTEGAIVTAYQPLPLAIIQQLDPIYVNVQQATTDLLDLDNRMKDGTLDNDDNNQKKVKLILDNGNQYPVEGILQFRDVTVDPTTGSVTLRIIFPNPEGIILPGMFVRAIIKEGVNNAAILIPQQAVFRDPKGNPIAMIVDAESRATPRILTIDRAVGDKWLLKTGITPGDRVIVEGLHRVRPGVNVKAVPYKKG